MLIWVMVPDPIKHFPSKLYLSRLVTILLSHLLSTLSFVDLFTFDTWAQK